MKNTSFLYILLTFLFALSSCEENIEKELQRATLKTPKHGSVIRWGETIVFQWKKDPARLDSIQISLDGKHLKTVTDKTGEIKCPKTKVGYATFGLDLYYEGKKCSSKKVQVKILSNTPEKQGSYEVVKVYPHDTTAYTQGLEFHNHTLFESTGLYGKSDLRITDLQTGTIKQKTVVDDAYFAEGISILNDKIYQLTWQERVCLVYNLNNLKLITQINYPQNIEGWGLTHHNEQLILSDGTEHLYFINPNDFTVTSSLTVFNYLGHPVKNLNELEIVNGKLLANIYTTDLVVEIDLETGAVESVYNLSGLLTKEDKGNETDVLNGIAYNPKTKQLYVTGKNWPKLFEIKLF